MTFKHFKLDIDGDGIALITWNSPDRTMNVIDMTVIEELSAIVEQVKSDAAIKGAVITSGKETFSAGADLTLLESLGRLFGEMAKTKGPEAAVIALFEESRKLSQLYRRLETSGKPWAAAVNGTAVGGGFELALACHHRVAALNPRTRVGLPEVQVGLFPGAGGTTRVSRMLPPADALQFLLKGDQHPVDRAKAMKLIDAVVPPADLVKAAKEWVKANPKAKAPWDTDGFRLPGGPVYSKAGMMTFPAANALYRRETYDNYPAARAILQAAYEGLQLPMDVALRVESRWFARILRTPEAACMMRTLFVSMQDINKGVRRPAAGRPATQLKRIGVIGAGFMGASIGYVTAAAGLEVMLIDRDQDSADKGKALSLKLIGDQVNRGRASAADRDALMGRITASADYGALKGCDLVIEAVFEDRGVKAEAIKKAQAAIGPDVVFGSNTSTLPITTLATGLKDPSRFVGIHFFSPVEKMMLVEIILGKDTSDAALATALDYARAIRKTPIVVNDSRGFYTSRGGRHLYPRRPPDARRGHPAGDDRERRSHGRDAGRSRSRSTTRSRVDLAWKILESDRDRPRLQASIDPRQKVLLTEMVERRGRLGRKNGKGFYDYPEKGPKKLWPGLADLQVRKLDPDTIDIAEIKHRLLGIQALETSRCFEEQVLTDPREADVGSILGFGFAPFTGGTLSFIDMIGTKNFVTLCERLAKKHGPRFTPNKLLVEMAGKGESFYGRFGPGRKAAA